LDQDNTATQSTTAITLGRKAWTAYAGPFLLALFLLGIVVPLAWSAAWFVGSLALIASLALIGYKVLMLMSVHLYWDDSGIWLYSGVFPWNKGIRGVKWRDLEEATYSQTMSSWMFKSYSMRLGHRFTKSNEILLTHIAKGHEAVMAINERHQDLARNNLLN
jgi:hypothetical protein